MSAAVLGLEVDGVKGNMMEWRNQVAMGKSHQHWRGLGSIATRAGSARLLWDRTFGYTADPTLGDFVLVRVFLFVLLAVSALAPPARNHSAFVSFLFVADLLVFTGCCGRERGRLLSC
jgi:hypothetical protein